jgi:hypothetical protein
MDKNNVNLFNNPMVEAALKAMTPEQLEDYQKMGEYMFSATNFEEKNPGPKDLEGETVKGVFYIQEALKSGLHPEDLEQKEIQLMHDIYGPEWYTEYGYTADEVPKPAISMESAEAPVVTKKQMKQLAKRVAKKAAKKRNPGANYKKKRR